MSIPAGHRRVAHTSDCVIEAWGPDRASCLAEALAGLVEGFAEVDTACATDTVPLGAEAGAPADELVSLLDDVIYTLDVFSVVPVCFHLKEAEDGGIAGDMEVVPVDKAAVVGPAPNGVSYHGLSMVEGEGGWRCRVLVDV